MATPREVAAAREKLEAVLNPITWHYALTNELVLQNLNDLRSPENIAALMARKDENAVIMQRMEDSSLRRLWRLTSILLKLRRGGLDAKETECEGHHRMSY